MCLRLLFQPRWWTSWACLPSWWGPCWVCSYVCWSAPSCTRCANVGRCLRTTRRRLSHQRYTRWVAICLFYLSYTIYLTLHYAWSILPEKYRVRTLEQMRFDNWGQPPFSRENSDIKQGWSFLGDRIIYSRQLVWNNSRRLVWNNSRQLVWNNWCQVVLVKPHPWVHQVCDTRATSVSFQLMPRPCLDLQDAYMQSSLRIWSHWFIFFFLREYKATADNWSYYLLYGHYRLKLRRTGTGLRTEHFSNPCYQSLDP